MALITYFVVQPFERSPRGVVYAAPACQAQSEDHAVRLAVQMAARHGGAIAFCRTGDPELGDYDDAEILRVCGEVPRDTLDAARAA